MPLIERLARRDLRPIVLVVAPAGYGKTTLLSQWAEHSDLAFAWVSLDEGDNDPKVLLSYVADALNAVEPIDRRVLRRPGIRGELGAGLRGAAAGGGLCRSMSSPVVLVLDDVHMLCNVECRAAVSVLADHVPGRSRLVLAGREEPPLRVARLAPRTGLPSSGRRAICR